MLGKLKKVMANVLGMTEAEVNDSLSMQNVAEWDSMKHMELIIALEDEFKIGKFSMDEMVKMTSYREIKHILENKGVTL